MGVGSDRLAGKIALVTGGTSGIGLATARRFADEGAYVFITGRRSESLAEAAKLINEERVTAVPGDVSRRADLDRLFSSKEQVAGFVDAQTTTIPLGRVGTTDEIAKVVAFLASDDSSFVDGVELFVDGGMTQI